MTDSGSFPPVPQAPLTNTGSAPFFPTGTAPIPKAPSATTDTGSFYTTNTGSYPAPQPTTAAATPPVTTFYLAPGAMGTPLPPPPISGQTKIGIDVEDEDEQHQPKYSDDPESRWYTTDQGRKTQTASRNGMVVLVVMLVMAILGGSGWLVGTYAMANRTPFTPPTASSTSPTETPSQDPVPPPDTTPDTPTVTPTVTPPTVGLPWISDVTLTSFVINVSVTNPDELIYNIEIFNMGVPMVAYYQQKALFRTYRVTVDGDYSDYPMDPTVMVTWK